jgi:hypothetical protein
MSYRTIRHENGDEAIADDMSPRMRAFCGLLEHANLRERAGLTPPACFCVECERHRATFERLSRPGRP